MRNIPKYNELHGFLHVGGQPSKNLFHIMQEGLKRVFTCRRRQSSGAANPAAQPMQRRSQSSCGANPALPPDGGGGRISSYSVPPASIPIAPSANVSHSGARPHSDVLKCSCDTHACKSLSKLWRLCTPPSRCAAGLRSSNRNSLKDSEC